MKKLGKFQLTWRSLKAETPVVAKRVGNALVFLAATISGYAVLTQNDKVAIGAAVIGVVGKILTYFFHDPEKIGA